MANIAENNVQVVFLGGPSYEHKKAALEWLTGDEAPLWLNQDLEEILREFEEGDCFDFDFDSKWVEPSDHLQAFCNKFNATVSGVVVEWGCGYHNSYGFEPIDPAVYDIDYFDENDELIEHTQIDEYPTEDLVWGLFEEFGHTKLIGYRYEFKPGIDDTQTHL